MEAAQAPQCKGYRELSLPLLKTEHFFFRGLLENKKLWLYKGHTPNDRAQVHELIEDAKFSQYLTWLAAASKLHLSRQAETILQFQYTTNFPNLLSCSVYLKNRKDISMHNVGYTTKCKWKIVPVSINDTIMSPCKLNNDRKQVQSIEEFQVSHISYSELWSRKRLQFPWTTWDKWSNRENSKVLFMLSMQYAVWKHIRILGNPRCCWPWLLLLQIHAELDQIRQISGERKMVRASRSNAGQ